MRLPRRVDSRSGSACISDTGGQSHAKHSAPVRLRRAGQLAADFFDDQRAVPILTIALDAGFGSLGPFNRAFRDTEPKAPANRIVPAEAVVQAVLRVLENKKYETVLPHWLAFLAALRRYAPGLFRARAQRRRPPRDSNGRGQASQDAYPAEGPHRELHARQQGLARGSP